MSMPDYTDYAEERDEPTREQQEGDAWEYWHQRAHKFETALFAITKLEPEPFKFPTDWHEQIAACSECQRYKDHPIQQGICNTHRKPLYQREHHDDHQQRTLIYRAQDLAREALRPVTSTQRHGES